MASELEKQFLKHQARHARRCWYEARVVLLIVTVALSVVSVLLYTQGYLPPETRPLQPVLILGIPSWVVWGLVVPWLVMIVVTWLFALYVMQDDEPYVEVPLALRARQAPAEGSRSAAVPGEPE